MPAPTSAGDQPLVPADGCHRDDNRQARGAKKDNGQVAGGGGPGRSREQRRQAPDDEQEEQEQGYQCESGRAGCESTQVEVYAGVDEEDRHQESERNGIDFRLDDVPVEFGSARDGHLPQNPGSEGTEQHVQSQHHAEDNQHREDEHDGPDGELAAGVEGSGDLGVEQCVPCARGEIDGKAGQEHKPEECRCCRAWLPAAEEQLNGNKRTELPGGTQCRDSDAQWGFGLAGVAKDWQQCPQRCGAQGDADDHGSLRASVSMNSVGRIQPSRLGPSMIPRTISKTTIGTLTTRSREQAARGAAIASNAIRTSEVDKPCISGTPGTLAASKEKYSKTTAAVVVMPERISDADRHELLEAPRDSGVPGVQ
ncbi:MAG: hypothetical protein JWR71_1861 [Pseudarthrobacter sp.]|nr:hypothetical protein [Pseudarthrobacter sp.]